MRQALDRYDRTFRLWNYDEFASWVRQGFPPNDRAALSAILGDFNGDHLPDLVLNGRTRQDGVIVVLLSDSAGYRAVEVSRWPGDTTRRQRPPHAKLARRLCSPTRQRNKHSC